MNESRLWTAEPNTAYLQWQTTEAAGADRRRFSKRSIVQHKAMFDRFLRHLLSCGVALPTFGSEHLESFFGDVDNRCAPGTTTRLRYVKLIDRLCRHLVDVGLRESNPAAVFALSAAWPEDEPEPLFLDTDADTALQGYVQPDAGDDARLCRNRAVVALLLGAGLTAAELRGARWRDVVIEGIRPQVSVPKRGTRLERTVALPPFSTPALAAWQRLHPSPDGALLFPAPRTEDKADQRCTPRCDRPRRTRHYRLCCGGHEPACVAQYLRAAATALWPHQRADQRTARSGQSPHRHPHPLHHQHAADLTSPPTP